MTASGSQAELPTAASARPALSLRRLAPALTAGVVFAVAVGIYPTWRAAGWAGFGAAAIALGLDIALLLAAAALTSRIARRKGPTAGVHFFLAAGMVRIGIIIGAGFAVVKLLELPSTLYWCWAAGAYLLLLFIVIRWAGRGLGAMAPAPNPPAHAPEGQA